VPLLEVHRVSKSFEGFRALNDVSLTVEEGTLYALIGPNGAGKTTLFNLITGRYTLDAGRVLFAGQDISHTPTHRIIHHGIGVSFQRAIPFSSMTVLENVTLAVLALDRKTRDFARSLLSYGDAAKRAEEIISWVGLNDLKRQVAASLSQGDLKRVDIALALASKPRLLLLDEPLAGLSRTERAQMVGFIRELLRSLGTTLLFTEHDTEAVLQLAGRIMVLHRGSVLAEGTPDEIRSHPQVQEAFLGREA
jgi:branched-chain amino acid transport system ATP-binding protein